jgi:hypothetical protein
MFVVRFAVVLVFVVMLLPTGPTTREDALRNDEQNQGFCGRYPKTCDASGELLDAFKLKLAYGISITRQALEGRHQEAAYSAPSQGGLGQAGPKFDDRYDVSRAPQRHPPLPERPQALSNEERSTEWRPPRN